MRILLLNQAFYPDVVSTAQHLADLAEGLARAGHQVTVICSSRAYDQPEVRFRKRELWQGIEILRLPCSAFGKRARWRRAADFATFLLSCAGRLFLLSRFDVVVCLTSPPLLSVLAAAYVKLKGGKLIFWVMDLNPDEAVAAGWLRRDSSLEKFLSRLLRFSLRASTRIIVLDAFMKDRLVAKGVFPGRVSVLPPWSHDDAVKFDAAGRDRFRAAHGFNGKYVVMYSGNHSPCHPLDTLLHAAKKLAANERLVFCFVGGGSEFEKVRRFAATHGLTNIVQLPYQPLGELAASLSAADLQVVIMGDPFVGIVHPCKIYNLLAVGAPVLYIGPEVSHISAILSSIPVRGFGRTARHGGVSEVVRHIQDAAGGEHYPWRSALITRQFSRDLLLSRMVALIESTVAPSWSAAREEREFTAAGAEHADVSQVWKQKAASGD